MLNPLDKSKIGMLGKLKDVYQDDNPLKVFVDKLTEEIKDMGHVNLIIAGKTGTGKSTLINAAFREDIAKTGMGKPVTDTDDVRWYEKEGYPLRLYDTIGLELDEAKRKQALDIILKTIKDARNSGDPDKFIHAMWYCVASDTDRLEEYEADYINSIAQNEVPVVLVVTKSYRKKHAERFLQKIKESYPDLRIERSVVVLSMDEDEEDCDEGVEPKKAFGVDTLCEMTAEIVPEAAQKAWCNAQKASLELKVKKARAIVISTAVTTFGEGFVPVPMADATMMIPTQLAMLAGVTAVFGINVSKSLLKSIVTSMIGVAGATFTGRTIAANLLKLIPIGGTVVGGTISGATAAVITIALGQAYIKVMKMIAQGEMSEKSLAGKEVQEQLNKIIQKELKEGFKKENLKNLINMLKNVEEKNSNHSHDIESDNKNEK